jgi:hypothetical protein
LLHRLKLTGRAVPPHIFEVIMALSEEEVLWNLALGYVGEAEIEDTSASRDLKPYLACRRFYTQARDEVLVSHLWNEAMVRTIILQEATGPLFGYDRTYSKPSDALRIVSVDDDLGSDVFLNLQGIHAWEVEADNILSNAGESPPTYATATEYLDGQFVSVTPTPWVTSTAYIVQQYVKSGTTVYEVLVAHTSDTIANDVTAGNLISRGTGSTVTYEVVSTYTSSSVTDDITAGNITATGDKVDARIIYVAYVKKLEDVTKFSPKLKQAIAMKLAIKIVTPLQNDPKAKADLIEEFEVLTMPKARSVDGMQQKPRPVFSSEWIRSRSTGARNTWR